MINLAIEYAKEKHKTQKRKYTNAPYFVHCEEVAKIFKEESYYKWGEDAICAAYLHDVVEDTETTLKDIKRIFGHGVAILVEQVTNVSKPGDGNRAFRKEIDRLHLARASGTGKSIKLADLISNSRDIVENDPKFAKTYLAEKERLLEVLEDGDKNLLALAKKVLKESKEKLGFQ